ncbi:glycosyltransferase family 1 protein [Anaeromyxobacter sp. SG17]|uniref:glycosyltransferase family 4 protein n=1 Tax=Anaeromyxobacter sp. SG17 TaxID=2925405 RepID=UPI001F578DA7|nr:glycosyltransferase family 1 protein [Anaeromyxobacter sp. SG17]
MRIGVSLLSFRPGKIGGAETYVRRLLASLPAAAGGDQLVAVLDGDLAPTLDTPGFERLVVPRGSRAVVIERIAEAFTPWRARYLERALRGAALDVTLFPQQSVFPRRAPGAAVVTVHDVQHLYHAERFPLFDRAFRAALYGFSLARASRVIAISEFTRRTLTERAGLPASRVAVIPHGFSPDPGPVSPREDLPRPYLYYPAATYPHKGHATLFRALAALRERGALAHHLVLTGERTSRWPELQRLARSLGISERVRHLGFLPTSEVRRVYAGADAVVFPSEYEGFGLPVLEAAALRRRLITARLEVFDEIGVPRAQQIDFGDPDQLLTAIRDAAPVSLQRRPLTWEEVAFRTLEALREAAREASADGAQRDR